MAAFAVSWPGGQPERTAFLTPQEAGASSCFATAALTSVALRTSSSRAQDYACLLNSKSQPAPQDESHKSCPLPSADAAVPMGGHRVLPWGGEGRLLGRIGPSVCSGLQPEAQQVGIFPWSAALRLPGQALEQPPAVRLLGHLWEGGARSATPSRAGGIDQGAAAVTGRLRGPPSPPGNNNDCWGSIRSSEALGPRESRAQSGPLGVLAGFLRGGRAEGASGKLVFLSHSLGHKRKAPPPPADSWGEATRHGPC